jgi:hypothetical protein
MGFGVSLYQRKLGKEVFVEEKFWSELEFSGGEKWEWVNSGANFHRSGFSSNM